MKQAPSDILSLTNEAAILIQRGRVSYANAAACRLLGTDCTGKAVKELLGPDVAGSQASSFVATVFLAERPYIVRVNTIEEGRLAFLSSPELTPAVANAPFLYELRSSLMTIGVAAEELRQQAARLADPGLHSSLSILTRSYYRLLRLTNNSALVLNAAQGTPPMSLSSFDLSLLCRTTLELIGDLNPDFHCQANLDEPVVVSADANLLRQLLLNLLSNCLLHAGPDCSVSVSLTQTACSAVLSISDNGCGIPQEALSMVFDRYRFGYQLGELGQGPGLGLTAARIITMIHGGTLLLESRPGHGTTVRASFSRELSQPIKLCAPGEQADDPLEAVLIGMSSCLPPNCYTEKYMD